MMNGMSLAKLPWREAGPPNHPNDQVDSEQQVVNKELSLSSWFLKVGGTMSTVTIQGQREGCLDRLDDERHVARQVLPGTTPCQPEAYGSPSSPDI